jgi:prefoldin beta subunit
MKDSQADLTEKIQTLQILEQNLQSILSQKQTFQAELNEIDNALNELKNYSSDVYKILSGIMIKTDKSLVLKELEDKKNISEIKISSIEKQESLLVKREKELKKEIISINSKKDSS